MSSSAPTPLLHLVAGGTDSPMALEVAKTRLADGDDPNMREDGDGLTPMHVAAHWDNLAMVQLLLLHGGDVWREDDHGRTPMSMAQGKTKKFLRRMAARSDGERSSIFSRMAHLHLGSRIGKALKGARKKMRQTLGAILPTQRRRADSECNNPAVLTSTPRPSIGGASVATSTSQYCTADEGTIGGGRGEGASGAERTMGARGSTGPSAHSASGLLNLEWKRPATPPTVEGRTEIGWRKGLEKKREDEKVTVRKKQRAPVEKNKEKEKDDEWRPTTSTESDAEEESGENPADSAKKPRAPRGLRKRVEEMSEDRLRSELRCIGVAAGPIGKGGVRRGYERKLIDALVVEGDTEKMKKIIDGVAPPPTSSSSKTPSKTTSSSGEKKTPGGAKKDDGLKTAVETTPQKSVQGQKYSRPLECAIAGRSSPVWQEGAAQALDESIRAYFMNKGVSSFCYLLVDPRMLRGVGTMGEFIDAIFYVGKGTKARPHQHLIDARNARDNQAARQSDKIARILSIWAAGEGVVSLQLSFDICDEEAFTREAALIDAIGQRNLTNARGGKYYGIVQHWQLLQKTQLGTLMLKRVWSYIRSDPSAIKPIRPEALPDALFKPYGGGARKTQPVTSSKPIPPPPGVLNRLRAGR